MPWNSNIGTYEGLMSAWLRFAKWTVKLFVKRPFWDFLLPEGGKSADQGTIWEGLGMLVIFTRKFVPAAFHELISLISISIIHRSISSIFQVVNMPRIGASRRLARIDPNSSWWMEHCWRQRTIRSMRTTWQLVRFGIWGKNAGTS